MQHYSKFIRQSLSFLKYWLIQTTVIQSNITASSSDNLCFFLSTDLFKQHSFKTTLQQVHQTIFVFSQVPTYSKQHSFKASSSDNLSFFLKYRLIQNSIHSKQVHQTIFVFSLSTNLFKQYSFKAKANNKGSEHQCNAALLGNRH